MPPSRTLRAPLIPPAAPLLASICPIRSTLSTGAKTFTGGGIFVQGNATVKLSPASGSTTSQTYTIVNNGVTTTITIDPAAGSAGTTTITTPGVGTQTINGVPQQMSSSGLSLMGDATMLYVNGTITALSGPGQGQAAIQNGTALSIVASGSNNITVTGDILYKTEPVTMTGTPSAPPIDQLIPANNTGQVLGIFTAGGNVHLNNSQSNGNLEIDASIATISATGSGGHRQHRNSASTP